VFVENRTKIGFCIKLPELFPPVNNKNGVLLPMGCEKMSKDLRMEGGKGDQA